MRRAMTALRSPRLSGPVLAGIAGVAVMLLVGALSGQDYNWDLLNYHYVSPRLLLAGEYRRNVAPSGLQSWFNPVGYVPAYLAIRSLPPWLASALFALVAGLNAPLIYLVADRIAADLPDETRTRTSFACVAIGITGAITLSEAGTSFLDDVLSIAILGAVLAMLRGIASGGAMRTRWIALAGLLLGAACGLKLTSIVMAVGMAAALLVLVAARRLPISAVAVLALGGLAGFLPTGGWWAWRLWAEFRNPVFPLFNELFRSPWAPPAPLVDTNFLPRHWTGVVTFPWHWLVGDATLGAEIPIRDPRYAVALLAAATALATAVARRQARDVAQENAALLVALFFVVTYLVWLFAFAILRYVVVLEMLSGVVLLVALRTMPGVGARGVGRAMIGAAFLILAATRPAAWGRVPFSGDWFGVRGVGQVHRPGTVYVLPDDAPLGFLLNAFPDDARFVRIGGNFPLTPGVGLGGQAADMIRSAPQLRSLAAAPDKPVGVAALRRFGLVAVPGSCRLIATKAADVESCALSPAR